MKRVLLIGDSRRDAVGIASVMLKLRTNFNIAAYTCSFSAWQESLLNVAPHTVVLNHMIGDRNVAIAQSAKSIGGKVVILPTEGRPNTLDQQQWYINQHSKNRGYIDLFLSWGAETDFLSPYLKTVVAGCPRMDVYKNMKVMRVLRDKTLGEYHNPKYNSIVVVFSSFPQAKFASIGTSFNEHDWKDLGVTGIPGRENPTKFAQSEQRARQEFSVKVLEFATNNKDTLFLVKPHPMEDFSYWDNLSMLAENIKMAHLEPSHSLLSIADGCISRLGCMTVLESAWAGVSVKQIAVGNDLDNPGNALDLYQETDGYKFIHISEEKANRYVANIGKSSNIVAKTIADMPVNKLDGRIVPNILKAEEIWARETEKSIKLPIDGIGQVRKNMTLVEVMESARWM